MVELTYRGTPPEERVLSGTCINCRSQMTFKQGEARVVDEPRETSYVVKCPICGHDVYGTLKLQWDCRDSR